MLKSIIKKIKKKPKQESSNFLDLEQVSDFKKNAWVSKGLAETYSKLVDQTFFNAVTANYFLDYIKPTDKVLDVGAGTGRLTFVMADKGCEVVATDISENMMEHIDINKGSRKISTKVAEGEKLPFEDQMFNVVTSLDLMVHFPQWQNFIKEQARVLKPGGYIIYNTYSGDNLKLIDEKRDYKEIISKLMYGSDYIANVTKEELISFCDENNLEVVKLQPYDYWASTALWCDNLEGSECTQLRQLYYKTLKNPKVLEIITKFEREIVKNLSHEDCALMIVVLRKKQ